MLRGLRSAQGPIRTACRRVSTVRVVAPAADSRHLALPLAFVSVKGWDDQGSAGWAAWAAAFSRKGYSSLLLEVDSAEAAAKVESPSNVLASLERELVRLLQDPAHSTPFPPLLFAHSLSALLAETYVSSHPLSGLCLVSPTPAAVADERLPSVFKTALDDFNYEPGFPIAVVEQEGQAAPVHRLVKEFAEEDDDEALVRRIVAGWDEQGWERVQAWMDENGL